MATGLEVDLLVFETPLSGVSLFSRLDMDVPEAEAVELELRLLKQA
ncbi:MAG: hypothetical protein U0452_05330 [Anaerolineae bacterium]